MSADDAVGRLEELADWNQREKDNEVAHERADQILLEAADPEVRAAYKRVIDTCDWWASA